MLCIIDVQERPAPVDSFWFSPDCSKVNGLCPRALLLDNSSATVAGVPASGNKVPYIQISIDKGREIVAVVVTAPGEKAAQSDPSRLAQRQNLQVIVSAVSYLDATGEKVRCGKEFELGPGQFARSECPPGYTASYVTLTRNATGASLFLAEITPLIRGESAHANMYAAADQVTTYTVLRTCTSVR